MAKKRTRNPVTTDALARRMYRMEDTLSSQNHRISHLLTTQFGAIFQMLAEVKNEQEHLAHRLEKIREGVWDVHIAAIHEKALIEEVNAHMWQTQNRLNAVRDILIEKYGVAKPTSPRNFSLLAWFRKRLGQ